MLTCPTELLDRQRLLLMDKDQNQIETHHLTV